MQIITIDLDLYNYVIIGDEAYFVLTINKSTYFIHDKCPHRGGPLHLGEFCRIKRHITCPWHNNIIPWSKLNQQSIPLVRVKNLVTALFAIDDVPALLLKKMIVARE